MYGSMTQNLLKHLCSGSRAGLFTVRVITDPRYEIQIISCIVLALLRAALFKTAQVWRVRSKHQRPRKISDWWESINIASKRLTRTMFSSLQAIHATTQENLFCASRSCTNSSLSQTSFTAVATGPASTKYLAILTKSPSQPILPWILKRARAFTLAAQKRTAAEPTTLSHCKNLCTPSPTFSIRGTWFLKGLSGRKTWPGCSECVYGMKDIAGWRSVAKETVQASTWPIAAWVKAKL